MGGPIGACPTRLLLISRSIASVLDIESPCAPMSKSASAVRLTHDAAVNEPPAHTTNEEKSDAIHAVDDSEGL
jgi:hypothetical protein